MSIARLEVALINIKGLISIIIPVYNVEIYLERCIESVINQTYRDLEIILIDDGSTDKSGEICDSYADTDRRIVVAHQENAGPSAARNRGLDIAKGEYIGFVDSDDYIDADMYQVMYNRAIESGCDIVECNLRHIYKNINDTEKVIQYHNKKNLICFGRGVVWNKLYRNALIRNAGVRFPTGLASCEDMEFYIKLVPHCNNYEYVDIAPYNYVQRKISLYNESNERTRHVFQALININEYYKQNGIYNEYYAVLEFFWARILLCSSFSRICGIPDVSVRNKLFDENWKMLAIHYPKWNDNAILKTFKSKQGMFMRSVNSITYKLYSKIIPVVNKVISKISAREYY